jgi:tRNA G18 (ribose-2'-O)-methylase SpoU
VAKTALGAEQRVPWKKVGSMSELIRDLKSQGFRIVGAEKNETSLDIRDWKPGDKTALLLGNEERGLSTRILAQCDEVVHLPMAGMKESLNVSVAAGAIGYDWLTKTSGSTSG